MTPDFFAYNQYRDHVIYKELARVEKVPEFKAVLEMLVQQELDDYNFWKQFASRKRFKVRKIDILFYKLLRRVLGLTFTAKMLEGHEKQMLYMYNDYAKSLMDEKLKVKLKQMIKKEIGHEHALISQVKEEKVKFTSSIVLGLNDGLIELTGALVGFSFALQQTSLVALTGFIMGIAAAMSMASSGYMQAQYERGKDARKAAVYTGSSYIIVVFFLIAPFFIFSSLLLAVLSMLGASISIIAAISFYTSVLFERKFVLQFRQMLIFSLGVAAIAFVVGFLFRIITGISV